jgi:hypothetical protein
MRISLFHNHYNEQHLEDVKDEMTKRGAPTVRAIWSEVNGEWMAVEGCHRLRAAEQLGLTPTIKDISNQGSVTIQVDGENVRVKVSELTEELQGEMHRKHSLRFGE